MGFSPRKGEGLQLAAGDPLRTGRDLPPHGAGFTQAIHGLRPSGRCLAATFQNAPGVLVNPLRGLQIHGS